MQVYDIINLMKLMSHDNKALTTGESLKLTANIFQMSEKEIMEWCFATLRRGGDLPLHFWVGWIFKAFGLVPLF